MSVPYKPGGYSHVLHRCATTSPATAGVDLGMPEDGIEGLSP